MSRRRVLDVGLGGRCDVMVLAPHPDDEIFGAGALMCALVAAGHRVRLVAVTDGEAAYGPLSAPASAALVVRRAGERHAALQHLGIGEDIDVVRLGLPDGDVTGNRHALADQIVATDAAVVVSTWRHDGHPDHEAVGAAAASAAARIGALHWEYPIWASQRGLIDPAQLAQGWEVPMTPATRAAKVTAARMFRSQLEPSPDGRPVVPQELIDRLVLSAEFVFA